MMKHSRPLSRDDFHVALLCALELEFDAVFSLFDEDWGRNMSYGKTEKDLNTYRTGRIGQHNVVLTLMPGMGKRISATVATSLQSSFHNINLALLVGICGGLPRAETDQVEIILGDVLISTGVIQYDFGRQLPNRSIRKDGFNENLPPPKLPILGFLRQLQGQKARSLLQNDTMSFLQKLINETGCDRLDYPGADQDKLYEADYLHKHRDQICESCQDISEMCDDAQNFSCIELNCGSDKIVPRERLIGPKQQSAKAPQPYIHFGLVASGDSVMKSGKHRDEIAAQENVIGFEMEGAGAWEIFPTMIVKGVCDYADSHKNKIWQVHAAATAAACTKAMLKQWDPVIPVTIQQPPNNELTLYHTPNEAKTPKSLMGRKRWDVSNPDRDKWPKFVMRISDYDQEKIQRRLKSLRTAETTTWFQRDPSVVSWQKDSLPCTLWCSGTVGSGKTTICTGLIDHLQSTSKHSGSPCFYFYYETTRHKHGATGQNAEAVYLFASLTKQIIDHLGFAQCSKEVIAQVTKFYNPKGLLCDLDDIVQIFAEAFKLVPASFYIIDGLDEMRHEEILSVLDHMDRLFNSEKVSKQKLLISSRKDLGSNVYVKCKYQVVLSEQTTEKDIRLFIESELSERSKRIPLTESDEIERLIQTRLSQQARGMFLWVKLQLDTLWATCGSDADIIRTLENLPQDLPKTYRACLQRLPNITRTIVPNVLRWIICASRPLHISELREAIAIGFGDREWNPQTLFSFTRIKDSCSNLIVTDDTDLCVRLVHPSLKQYLCIPSSQLPIEFEINEEKGVLRCGEECVKYLSFTNLSLQKQASSSDTSQMVLPHLGSAWPLLSTNPVAKHVARILTGKPSKSNAKRTIPIVKQFDPQSIEMFQFLNYARQNWAPQTKSISSLSPVWTNFQRLTEKSSSSYGMQPWGSSNFSKLGPQTIESDYSYFHNLLSYATREIHVPLLKIVISAVSRARLEELCNIPLAGTSLPALHTAAKLGSYDITLLLLKFGKINALDYSRRTPLHYAAEKAHTGVMSLLLEKREILVSELSLLQETPLTLAVLSESRDAVTMLLNHGVELKPDDCDMTNPVVAAAAIGNLEILELLVKQFGDGRIGKNVYGLGLRLAAEGGYHLVVEFLLTCGHVHADFQGIAPQSKRLMLSIVAGKRQGVEQNLWFEQTPLSIAAEKGHEAVVQLLLSCSDVNVNFNHAAPLVLPPLMLAIQGGHEGIVKLLLNRSGVDVNCVEKTGLEPLILTLYERGHVGIITLLLSRSDINVNGTYGQRATPLMIAIELGDEKLVELLLNRSDVNVNFEDGSGRSPLMLATELGHGRIVTLLLHRDDIYVQPLFDGQSPLFWAASRGFDKIVELLLARAYVNADWKDDNHQTSLSIASQNGHKAVVRLLLRRGDVDIRSKERHHDRTPLLLAAVNGHDEVVDLLLEQEGLKLEEEIDTLGRSPLSLASEAGHKTVVQQLLARDGCNLNAGDWLGRTPLWLASAAGHETIVKQLLGCDGCDLNAKDMHGSTPLHPAIRHGHEKVVKLLLEQKEIAADSRDHNGQTPLILAVKMNHVAIVKLLLERHDGNVFAKDNSGHSSLYWAKENMSVAILKLLLKSDFVRIGSKE